MHDISCIGIDLGTTFSCVAVSIGDRTEIIPNKFGNRTTPSCVAFTETERLVGESAVYQASGNLENTVFQVKRLIGRDFDDPNVQKDCHMWPFKLARGLHNKPLVEVRDGNRPKKFSPEEISAMVLTTMKEAAEDFLGHEVHDAVVTIPAYFNGAQRRATKDAGAKAGLNVKRLLFEPTAAALAYGLQTPLQKEKKVLVFDLGGGTYDVSLLTMQNKVFEVKATSGNTHLGGEDFTDMLTSWCKKDFQEQLGGKVELDSGSLKRLRDVCERGKRTLSTAGQVLIRVEKLFQQSDYKRTVTRVKFEEICEELFISCLKPLEQVLFDAKVSKESVDEILLVGGSSRIPKIQELVRNFFGRENLCKKLNPDEVVAEGAAIEAASFSAKGCFGIQLVGVNPLTLGTNTEGDRMSKIIPRGTRIPVTMHEIYTTATDNQESVRIGVYEGEKSQASENNLLGDFLLSGIPPAVRGVPKIKVVFHIDQDGILTVTATEMSSGRSHHIAIEDKKRQF